MAVKRTLTRLRTGYAIAVAMMVVLMLVEHAAVQFQLVDLDEDAALINLAGRQRMLGQQLAKYAGFAAAATSDEASTQEGYASHMRAKMVMLEEGRSRIAAFSAGDAVLEGLLREEAKTAAALFSAASAAAGKHGLDVRSLGALADRHLQAADAVTRALQAGAEEKQGILRVVDLMLLAFSVSCVIAIVALLIRPTLREARASVARLERARITAESSAQHRARFAANVSHELRTPLNGILGMARLLQKSTLTSRQQRYADVVASSAEHLKALVDDILDFSKVQANAMTLERIEVDLPELASNVVREQTTHASAKGIDIYLEIDPALDGTVLGDPLRLRQCLTNLLSNAVKFTDEGWVSVEVIREDPQTVRLEVSDTGAGVAPHRASAIFDAFQQEDISTTRQHGGTGLGLAITRKLARVMGGDAGFRPREGGGSRFFVTARLPVAQPRARCCDVPGTILLVGMERRRRRALEPWLRAWSLDFAIVDASDALVPVASSLEAVGGVIADGRTLKPGDASAAAKALQLPLDRFVIVSPQAKNTRHRTSGVA